MARVAEILRRGYQRYLAEQRATRDTPPDKHA
jgi:hypothetical protein